jgi:multicomponent K+:H+ antiporter subunit D
LSAALQTSSTDTPSLAAWSLVAAVLLSGLAGIIALGRTGIRLFWSSEDTITPRLRVNEAAPVGVLILACVALAFWAGPVMHYMGQTASYLDRPASYINAVLTQSTTRTVEPRAAQ